MQPMGPWEIWTYDVEDGLDWATRCRCDALYYVPKAKLRERRGVVGVERQRMISQTLLRFFPFTS